MKSNEITLEMVVTPQAEVPDKEFRQIVTLASSEDGRNLTLGQRGHRSYGGRHGLCDPGRRYQQLGIGQYRPPGERQL